jgi:hypothetical protein
MRQVLIERSLSIWIPLHPPITINHVPIPLNVNELWKRLAGKMTAASVNSVAQRFLQIFHNHVVQPAQIPRLLPQIKLDDLKSEEALLSVRAIARMT